jgi:hypothetical protein
MRRALDMDKIARALGATRQRREGLCDCLRHLALRK